MNGSTKKLKKKFKKYMESNENENKGPKSLGCSKSNHKRKVYSKTGLLQEARKILNKQPNLTPKRVRKMTMKPKFSRREIIKIRAEINDMETKLS